MTYLKECMLGAGVGHIENLFRSHIYRNFAEIGSSIDELELSGAELRMKEDDYQNCHLE